jgi:uncharacterized protein YkwD
LVVACLGLALAACGGGGGGGGGDDDEPTSAVECGLQNFSREMLQRVNAHRAAGASCGARGNFGPADPLSWNDALTEAAAGHSADMAARDFFEHTNPDGKTLGERVDEAGYSWRIVAENLAAGQTSVAQVVEAWMKSEGHCANIMNPALRDVGAACVRSDTAEYDTYWTMDLGAR